MERRSLWNNMNLTRHLNAVALIKSSCSFPREWHLCGVSLHSTPWYLGIKAPPTSWPSGIWVQKRPRQLCKGGLTKNTYIHGERFTKPRTFQGCKYIYVMSYCTTSSLSHLLNYPMNASSCAFFYDFSWKRSLWVTENSTRIVHKSDCTWGGG